MADADFLGYHEAYNRVDRRTYFTLNLYDPNFNAASVECRYIGDTAKTGCFGHDVVHFTRMVVQYVATDANTQVRPYLIPGETLGSNAVMHTPCSSTEAGKILIICSGPIDVAMDPRDNGQAVSAFAAAAVSGVNAADDIYFEFTGWFWDNTDDQPDDASKTPYPQSVSVDRMRVWPWERG